MRSARPDGPATKIHTLGARESIMFEVLREYFALKPEVMQRQIQLMLAQVEEVLSAKGIDYQTLRTGLVPQVNRREVALFFDTAQIAEKFYGYPIHAALLPLLSRGSTHSVLAGDYVGGDDRQDLLFEAFTESVSLARSVTWTHSSQFHVVYLNNLTDAMMDNIHQSLSQFTPFVGSADMTYMSLLKFLLSMTLSNSYIKHRMIAIMPHEDDVDNAHNFNIRGYPFEEFGYRVRSLHDSLFASFLSYKIERPVFPGFETDTEFSITGVQVPAIDLKDLAIEVEESKFKYLGEKKRHHLLGLGLDVDSSPSDLATLIAAKVASNYIYNMSYQPEHQTTKFNIMLEHRSAGGPPFRAVAALEYAPDTRSLRLITLT